MGTVKENGNVSSARDFDELKKYTAIVLQKIIEQVNGNLNFGLNVQASGPLTAIFRTANEDVVVSHGLNRVPTGFLVISTTDAMSVYRGNGSWTQNTIVLRSDAIGTALVFAI